LIYGLAISAAPAAVAVTALIVLAAATPGYAFDEIVCIIPIAWRWPRRI
jgi:hypothetical protein